jgi:hypothetical protein
MTYKPVGVDENSLLPPRVMAELDTRYGSGGSAVSSVNGKTGAVVLAPSDIGAATAAQGAKADSATQGGYVKPGTGIPKTDLATVVQTSLGKADSSLQSVPDATAVAKGAVQLAGDLGGTAAAPTVPGLAGKAPIASPVFTGTPQAPTTVANDSTKSLATTEYVQTNMAGTVKKSLITAKGDLLVGNQSGLPLIVPVGADGQVLTADSAQTNGVKWSPAGGASFPNPYTGGLALTVPPLGLDSTSSQPIGNQPAGNRLVWFPIDLGACTITGFTLNVSAAGDGAAIAKVGIYYDIGGIRPGNLIATLGTVSVTSTGIKTLSGLTQAWAGGRLWIGAVEQAHTSTAATFTTDTIKFSTGSRLGVNIGNPGICQDSVSGALPADATGENANVSARPRVYLTIA